MLGGDTWSMFQGYTWLIGEHGTWSMMGHERGGKLMELDQNLEI